MSLGGRVGLTDERRRVVIEELSRTLWLRQPTFKDFNAVMQYFPHGRPMLYRFLVAVAEDEDGTPAFNTDNVKTLVDNLTPGAEEKLQAIFKEMLTEVSDGLDRTHLN